MAFKSLPSCDQNDWHYRAEKYKTNMERRWLLPALPTADKAGQTSIHARKLLERFLSFSEPGSLWQLSMGTAAFHKTRHGQMPVSKMLDTPSETELRCCRQVLNYYRQVELPQQLQLQVRRLKGFLSSGKFHWESIQFQFYKAVMQNTEYLMLPLYFWFQGTKVALQYTHIYQTEAAGNADRWANGKPEILVSS